VLRFDVANNRLVVGTKDQLLSNRLFATKLSWVLGKAPQQPINITAKIRYQSLEAAAKLYIRHGRAEVQFAKPQRAIAPGQAVVFYQGETILGGGIIENRVD
jgi:tRNA-specific 2-thiouridylase